MSHLKYDRLKTGHQVRASYVRTTRRETKDILTSSRFNFTNGHMMMMKISMALIITFKQFKISGKTRGKNKHAGALKQKSLRDMGCLPLPVNHDERRKHYCVRRVKTRFSPSESEPQTKVPCQTQHPDFPDNSVPQRQHSQHVNLWIWKLLMLIVLRGRSCNNLIMKTRELTLCI